MLADGFKSGTRDWTVFELIRILSQRDGQNYGDYYQQSHSFRRKKISNAGLYETSPVYEVKSEPEEKQMEVVASDGGNGSAGGQAEEQETEAFEDAMRSSRAMTAWQSGQVDWMGAQKSDKIIAKLKDKINY